MSDPSPPGEPVLPVFAPDAQVCGNCKLWRAHSVDHRGWVGPCRLQPNRGLFPPTAPVCDAFAAKGVAVALPRAEPVRARPLKNVAPLLVKKRPEGNATVELGDLKMTREELMEIFLDASGHAEVPLAAKWEGGVIQLIPGKSDLQAKELPINALFHKVVMLRDRLRVLEQKLNAHPKLSDAEKIEMQQYITRCYGSLTTFNILFRDRDDQFVGSKEERGEG